jgi:hypothetical protein
MMKTKLTRVGDWRCFCDSSAGSVSMSKVHQDRYSTMIMRGAPGKLSVVFIFFNNLFFLVDGGGLS